MKTEELKKKIIQQLRFHRISGKHEDITVDHILEIVEKYRTQCDALPGDDLVEGKTKFNKEEITAAKYIRNSLIGKKGVDDFKKAYMAGEIVMADELSPIIASKDARIMELEEENKKLQRMINLCKASINGALDGLELDNTSDVIEKSLVIEHLEENLKILAITNP